MKTCPFLFLIFIAFSFSAYSQGTSRFEVWGLTSQTKEEFIEQYKEITSFDLNYSSPCAADLKKMGYPDAQSLIWVNDLENYLAGKVDWDTTERLAIIRPMPSNLYNESIRDSLNRKALEATIHLLEEKDTAFTENYLITHKDILYRLLVGLNSKNNNFREDCKIILNKAPKISLEETSDNIMLLGSLLSIPDPEISYVAMSIISNSEWNESINKSLFSSGVATLINMLNSDLRTFREDAIMFLQERLKTEQFVKKDADDWISWLDSQHNYSSIAK